MFPSEADSPGAKDVNAAAYLYSVLTYPHLDPDDREFVRHGVVQLDAIAQGMAGRPFPALRSDQREAALRRLETTHSGRAWIVTMLGYVLEALFTDPAYGGNPNGVGWKWLEHQPGFPRPPSDKLYYVL